MSLGEQRMAMIRERLETALKPESIEIIDESHKHAGHASAGGAGHFEVRIVSAAFEAKGPVQRHRMVFEAVADLMQSEIHALTIQADTPK
ncbi:MAG: BolA family transcriptional regulator [Chromatiales bacterium]|nr:BolA family transcriptional regulator [Chromatiales bacterium]